MAESRERPRTSQIDWIGLERKRLLENNDTMPAGSRIGICHHCDYAAATSVVV